MEGYQNYQQVINAIKAEYVNARNLKKTANTKKREAKNSASFKTRKENEKSSLAGKLTSVDNLLDSNLSTSITNLDDAKYQNLKSKLSELQGKLAFIDADILKLDEMHSTDPTTIGSIPHADKTLIEAQTLTVLRNMLSVTINDAESVINNIYDGQDYYAIKSATLPNKFSHTEQEVRNHYEYLRSVFDQLFDKTQGELSGYVIEVFTGGAAANSIENQLIENSKELFELKTDLATLLENQGPESSITAKELEIDSLKTLMLLRATDLKELEVQISNALSPNKLRKLNKYAKDLTESSIELTNYRQDNKDFLQHQYFQTEDLITWKSFDLYSNVFEILNGSFNNDLLSINKFFEGGQSTEFRVLKNQISDAKYQFAKTHHEDSANEGDINSLDSLQSIFVTGFNGTNYYDIQGFKPEVSKDTKEFFVNYSHQLHDAVTPYIAEKTKHNFYKNAIGEYISYFDNLEQEKNTNVSALQSAISNFKNLEYNYLNKNNGHYEGTQEQYDALESAKSNYFNALIQEPSLRFEKEGKMNKFDLYNDLFPEFYSTLGSLEYTAADATINEVNATTYSENLQASRDAAYDYLQTLTVGEADYIAALYEYEKQSNEVQLAINGNNLLVAAANQSYDFLQTTLSGEAEYQAALPEILESSTPPLYTQEYVNSVTALHYVYLGAQSDYDTKDAARIADYETNVAPFIVLKNDAYTFLQDLTDEDAAYQAALTDWNSKVDASNLFFNLTLIPAQQAHQAAVDAISQHISSSWGSDLNLSYSGSTLKAFKDDKNYAVSQHQQLIDSFPTIEADFQTAKDVMTFVEATPLEKRDAIRISKDLDKLRKQIERLYSLTNRNIQFMPTIGGWIIDFASIVHSYTESYFDGLLQSVKNFMESNTLYSSKLVDKKHAENEVNRNRARLENHYKSIISDWNLNFYAHSDDIVSTTGCDSFAELKSQTDRFMNKIQDLNNSLFRIDNGTNFADRIIDEVNNGTPLA